MSEEIEEIPIRVRIKEGDTCCSERVLSLPIISPQRETIPLRSVADWSVDQQLFNIPRRNSSRCNTIYGYVAAGELPVVLESRFKQALARHQFTLPPGYRVDFGGVSQERNSAIGNLMAYAAIIAVLMVSVLVVTFGSFRHAGIIGMVGLLSIGPALLSLWLFDYPIGIVSIIGLLGMVGLAINDSIIVLIDARQTPRESGNLAESVRHSTRHVLTTSFTTVAGVTPLILAGGGFWPPMMIVIAGGVVGATVLALGFTPAMHSLIARRATP
jgi:multidrug efflux pump subunit AcrB